jgi:dipeptidyl aminopeptidase/acylaminoacyl peptidase
VAASPGQDNEALVPGLYLIDPLGAGAPVRIADQQAFRPRWSPSGRYLTFTTGDGCALYDRQEDTSRQVEAAWCGGAWSPHERYLAYSDTSLELVDVETGEVQSLSPYPAVDLRWSPDGGWLLCLRQKAEDRFDLLALRTADGALRPVAYQVSRDALRRATWVPSECLAFLGTSQALAYGKGGGAHFQERLGAVAILPKRPMM